MYKKIILLLGLLLSFFTFGCDKKTEQDQLKETLIAIFADNQISSTSLRYQQYLRNHLNMCKEKNVDVIMIPGDLVNNAESKYYTIVEDILKETYGEDESLYPEFVYTMGNHEWWDLNEKRDPNAVKLYNRHARIDTKNLRRKTEIKPDERTIYTYGNYYKVVNGIPFFSISGENDSGLVSSFLQEELKEWLKEASNLPSVKKGGPIFFSYHYPFPNVTYSFGQGANVRTMDLYNIIKDYPQVILFSGDTHFAGANERTINQVDFTNINIGSSSYSRHVCRSVTMDEDDQYENIKKNLVSKDLLTGPVAEGYDKTPHIQFAKVDVDGNVTINRYFSSEKLEDAKHLGLEWTIPAFSNKNNYIYTSERYENKEWAYKLYGKNGLTWENTNLDYSYNNGKLITYFHDVTDYNYCEHYRIVITSKDDEQSKYDFVSHYYKWEDESHDYAFEIEGIGYSDIKKVEVYAFDYFDNISLNHLEK